MEKRYPPTTTRGDHSVRGCAKQKSEWQSKCRQVPKVGPLTVSLCGSESTPSWSHEMTSQSLDCRPSHTASPCPDARPLPFICLATATASSPLPSIFPFSSLPPLLPRHSSRDVFHHCPSSSCPAVDERFWSSAVCPLSSAHPRGVNADVRQRLSAVPPRRLCGSHYPLHLRPNFQVLRCPPWVESPLLRGTAEGPVRPRPPPPQSGRPDRPQEEAKPHPTTTANPPTTTPPPLY